MHAVSRLAGLRELPDVRMLWFSGWYDGPLTGLATHDGREYWFVMVLDDGGEHWDPDPRVYVLHRLAAEELALEWEKHRSFAACGLPGCLHLPRCPADGSRTQQDLDELYARWPPGSEDHYEEAPAVGWFTR